MVNKNFNFFVIVWKKSWDWRKNIECYVEIKVIFIVIDVYINIWVRKYCFCMVSNVSFCCLLMMYLLYECNIFVIKRMLLIFEEYGNI